MTRKPIAVVTGGAGFIGSHMVDLLLKQNFEVRVIDNFTGGHEKNLKHNLNNTNLEVENLDIINLENNNKIFNDVSYVFHFAGIGDIVPSIEIPENYMHTNVFGTVKVLEASRYNSVKKFIYAASSSCYGLANTPTDEHHSIKPEYPYALSKYQGEECCIHWNKVYNLPIISLRIFNAYGVRVRTTGAYGAVFGVFLKQKLENKKFTVVGDGLQKRDFLYVTDVVKAFLKAAESKISCEIYNLGAGNPQTIKYLTELIGGNIINLPKRPGEPECTWANINKIKKDLKWEPIITFEKGVKMMVDDILSWQEAPLWDVDSIEIATKKWFEFMDKK